MATIKTYTDIEQSKKLAEILPTESADMCWCLAVKGEPEVVLNNGYNKYGDFEKPCWSLAALFNVLPESYQLTSNKEGKVQLMLIHQLEMDYYDNPVDACVGMVIKLNELKLL